jgi:hypothetical protein
MNKDSEASKKAEDIRHNIDLTRQRMDETIDALAGRMKGRHLLDEVVGYFRTDSGQENAAKIKEKVTETAGTAMNTVVNSIKSNPWPALLIGAGVAWLVYSNRRSASAGSDEYMYSPYENDLTDEAGYEVSGGGYGTSDIGDVEYGSDIASSNVSSFDADAGDQSGSRLQGAKDAVRERATQARDQIQAKASQVGQRVREGASAVRNRASQLSSRVQEQSRHLYEVSRERVVTTANAHPVELGLGCLALGLIAGLAIPTPNKVNQVVGPRADRLRDQARQASREFLEKSKNVARAAAEAARREAESQGLTAEALRSKAEAVANTARDAATNTAREQGVMPNNG